MRTDVLIVAVVAVLLMAAGCSQREQPVVRETAVAEPAIPASGAAAGADDRPAVATLEARLTALLALQEGDGLGFGASFAVGLPDGQVVGAGRDRLFVSASAAKLYWVTAAVRYAGVEAVQPHAEPIFAWSDNEAAGAVIDLVGIDAVNRFLRDEAGLRRTGLVSWSFSTERAGEGFPGPLDGDNYTTTEDAVSFLVKLANGDLLEREETAAVLNWMTLSPRGYGGGIGFASTLSEQLPDEVRALVMHKGAGSPRRIRTMGHGCWWTWALCRCRTGGGMRWRRRLRTRRTWLERRPTSRGFRAGFTEI